ncbi:MAG: flavoprotein [Nitrospinae bacterium CG11_big_fil_rev_8_21_14_0_20_56_8]|nr:MAG: flavoprotein [Nitrospinae bacterium CG11_big_fil_rev_8_21_14_0_20_56_8]
MSYLVIAASLNPNSKSRVLSDAIKADLEGMGSEVDWLDLSEQPLPLCDGDQAYDDPRVEPVRTRIHQASGILMSVPIYNFYPNAAVKNLVELTGNAWKEKVVGFLCAAGGQASYMSVMGLANSLMLDFRCLVVPRFVYATGQAFADGQIADPEIRERITRLAKEFHRICRALEQA